MRELEKRKGKIFEIATKELSAIPIIFLNEAVSSKITEYTKDIIEAESRIHNMKLDTVVISSLQEKSSTKIALIDREVYELYGLTDEEIEMVEQQAGKYLASSLILEGTPSQEHVEETIVS